MCRRNYLRPILRLRWLSANRLACISILCAFLVICPKAGLATDSGTADALHGLTPDLIHRALDLGEADAIRELRQAIRQISLPASPEAINSVGVLIRDFRKKYSSPTGLSFLLEFLVLLQSPSNQRSDATPTILHDVKLPEKDSSETTANGAAGVSGLTPELVHSALDVRDPVAFFDFYSAVSRIGRTVSLGTIKEAINQVKTLIAGYEAKYGSNPRALFYLHRMLGALLSGAGQDQEAAIAFRKMQQYANQNSWQASKMPSSVTQEKPGNTAPALTLDLVHRALDQQDPVAMIEYNRIVESIRPPVSPEQIKQVQGLIQEYEEKHGNNPQTQVFLQGLLAGLQRMVGQTQEASASNLKMLDAANKANVAYPISSITDIQNQVGLVAELAHRGFDLHEKSDFLEFIRVIALLRQRAGLIKEIETVKELNREYEARYGRTAEGWIKVRELLASSLTNIGQYDEAEAILLDLSAALVSRKEKSPALLSLDLEVIQLYAQLLCSASRYDECLSLAQKGLGLIDPRTSPQRSSNLNMLMADAYMQLGRWMEAESALRKSSGSLGSVIPVAVRLTAVYFKQTGRESEIKSQLRSLDKLARSLNSLDYENNHQAQYLDLLRALFLFWEGRIEESQMLALKLSGSSLAPILGGKAAALRGFILASAARKLGSAEESLDYSRAAVKQLFGDSDPQGYPIFRILIDDRAVIEENLLALNLKHDDSSQLQEAFGLIQLARNGGVSNAITHMSARLAKGDSELARAIREQQDLSRSIAAQRKRIIEGSLASGPNKAVNVEEIQKELKTAAEKSIVLERDIAERFPEYVELTRSKPVSITDVQPLLKPDEALLAWFIGKEGSWAVAVRSNTIKLVRIPAEFTAVSANAAALRQGVDLERGTFLAFPANKAHELYQSLMAPLMPDLSGVRHVYVVPDTPFSNLPLSLLLTQKSGKGFINPDDVKGFSEAPWLIRQFSISVLPSVSSLRALGRMPPSGNAADSFLGIGDPLLANHPSRAGKPAEGAVSQRIAPVSFRGMLADVGEIAKLPSLPETAEELAHMGLAFSPTSGRLILREGAVEKAVKSEALDHYRVIAFATHGLVAGDFRGLAEPGLVLTPPHDASVEDDGVLTASEVANLKLNADWVLLSACNTASADGSSNGEGMSGLAKAFFYAGARTLMVSHWRVPSATTVDLTTRTVMENGKGLSPADAHRIAMLSMIQSGQKEKAHPSSWAAFVTVGKN